VPADAGAITGELLALAAHVHGAQGAAIVEAIGRAGDVSALPALTEMVAHAPDAYVGQAAALALGRFGRRGIALDDPARLALAGAAMTADASLRYAAAYALAKEKLAADAALPADDHVLTTMRILVGDPDAEVRAVTIAGLARRKLARMVEPKLIDALGDADWRVAVEAARALASDPADPTDPLGEHGREALAAFTARTWALVATGRAHPPDAHVVLEALRGLSGHVASDPVREMLASIGGAEIVGRDGLSLGWAQCLARAAQAKLDGLGDCGGAALPAFERDVLVANAIAAGAGGTLEERAARLAPLLGSKDVRVKAAAIAAAPKTWSATPGEPRDEMALRATEAIGSVDDAAIEAAADAAAAYLADPSNTGKTRIDIAASLLARADKTVNNPEVQITVLGDLAAAKLTDAVSLCEKSRADLNRAVSEAGRDCVKALSGTDPGPASRRTAPDKPPVDPGTVLGKQITWTVETTRGTITMSLDPDLAPWHVAAIVALTRAHFYDGLIWHRVVPDFVVQGGDPTGTGAGGPGYTLPAEPGSLLDGGGFTTGAVGIADAGPDTGGSQWFVMHDHAPHLDGRYTRIGAVVTGQDVVDALQVDDRIVTATVDVR
jgi:cyclophilin family peptidyl-prolyl cis-trans isomerase